MAVFPAMLAGTLYLFSKLNLQKNPDTYQLQRIEVGDINAE